MSQLFGAKKSQSNGLLNPAGIFNAKNQKGMGMANKSVKSDKEIEEIIYKSGICVRGMIMNGKSEAEMHQMIGVSEEYRKKMLTPLFTGKWRGEWRYHKAFRGFPCIPVKYQRG